MVVIIQNVFGNGMKKSIELIRKYHNIESSIEEVLIGEGKRFQAPDSFDYKRSRQLLTEAPHYLEEYDKINVIVEPQFWIITDTIFSYLKKNTTLSDVKIKNRLKFMYPENNAN